MTQDKPVTASDVKKLISEFEKSMKDVKVINNAFSKTIKELIAANKQSITKK